MDPIFSSAIRPMIGGHRGTAVHGPGNTFPAFEKALALGADYIELDIRLSRDDVPVVIHDALIDATTDGMGRVCDYTLKELKQFDAGGYFAPEYAGTRIPTLAEALAWARNRTWLSIEIKSDRDYSELIEALAVACAEEAGMVDQVQFMACDRDILRRIKRLNGGVTTCLLLDRNCGDPPGFAEKAEADAVNMPWDALDRETVDEIHRRRLLINGSLVNDPRDWREAQRLGIDMVDSDVPDLLKGTASHRSPR